MGCLTVAPPSVAEQLEPGLARVIAIKIGQKFAIGDAAVTPVGVNHGPISKSTDNYGYHIDCGRRQLFFMGDTKVDSIISQPFDTVLIPIGGNKVFSAQEAAKYLGRIGFSGSVIPIHTEISAEDGAMDKFIELIGNGLHVARLSPGESVEL